MLVLSRKKDQAIMFGDNIEITIIEMQGEHVKIGINAPKNVTIYRKELFIEIQEENEKAAISGINKIDDILKSK